MEAKITPMNWRKINFRFETRLIQRFSMYKLNIFA